MEKYADLMDLNVWTRSTIDGENATYDEKTKRWTVTVDRRDSSQRILHPKWLIIASGITGTLPDPPNVPGSVRFG
jgi:cation diffusion facilitator CzcD-associated flavoprotein CzcO